MEVLSKDRIEQWIIPYLSKGSRGPEPEVELAAIVGVIVYRLKERAYSTYQNQWF